MQTKTARKKSTKKQRTSYSSKEPEFNPNEYRESLRDMLVWSRTYASPAKIRKWAKEYLDKNSVSLASDYEVFYVGVLGRLKSNGVELKETEENHLQTRINELKEKYGAVKKDKKEDKEEKDKPKISVQEKVNNLADVYTEEFDLAVDEFVEEGVWNFDAKAFLAKNKVSPQVAKKVAENIKQEIKEPANLLVKKDKELEEGYQNYSKSKLKKLVKNSLEAISTLESHTQQRKTRVRKTKSPAQIANKVQYKTRDEDLGLESIKPEKIVDSNEVWLYNTKKRKLAVYKDTGPGMTVRGTSIVGYDNAVSKMKTVRKPEEFFKELEKGGTGKRVIQKLFKNLRAKETSVRPRINKDTIILRVF